MKIRFLRGFSPAIPGWIVFATILCMGRIAFSQPVVSSSPPIPSLMHGAIAWADYDGDSNIDLLICGLDTSGMRRTYLLHNSGSSMDIDTSQSLMQVSDGDAAWGDIDNDGDPDLVLTGETSPRHSITQVYLNNSGSLSPLATPTIPGLVTGRTRLADLDADGDLDMFLTGFNEVQGFQGLIARNDGGGNFTKIANPVFATKEWTSTAVGDFDGNGLPDISYSDISPRLSEGMRTVVLRNNGNLHFTPVTSNATGLYGGSLDFADLDGDNDLDLLASGTGISPHVATYLYDNGQFTLRQSSLVAMAGEAAFSDFDQDGDPDVVAAGRSSSGLETFVYQNSGGGLAVIQGPASMPMLYHARIAFGDWNGDGHPDLAIMGQNALEQPEAYIATWNQTSQQFKF
jgi:hypothetical protein